MKLGDVIEGYRITTRPGNAGAGKCLWAFAERDGAEFFVKEFLDPKIPKPDSMGSIADKERRYAECQKFEQRHREIMRMLPADDLDAGNLVLAVAFFAHGTRYYKVTPRVHAAEGVRPHQLGPRALAVLLGTLLDSLCFLHKHGIVHGDLKPDNVLLHRPPGSDLCTAKLIDFDDAYLSGAPPGPDIVGGNPSFGAPELLHYLRGETATLTTAADLFAVALLAHQYLTGAAPAFPDDYTTPAEAVASGAALTWHPRLTSDLAALLTQLTDPDPTRRPTARQAAAAFDDPHLLTLAGARRSRLRINI